MKKATKTMSRREIFGAVGKAATGAAVTSAIQGAMVPFATAKDTPALHAEAGADG